jgi:hypothetical protein
MNIFEIFCQDSSLGNSNLIEGIMKFQKQWLSFKDIIDDLFA